MTQDETPDLPPDNPDEAAPADRRAARRQKRIQVAVLRMMGSTQEQAAKLSGCTDRTVRRWEADRRWRGVQAEAETRFLPILRQVALSAVFRSLEAGNAGLALEVLARVDPETWAPPKARLTLDIIGGDLPTLIRNGTDEQVHRIALGESPASVFGLETPKGLATARRLLAPPGESN